MVHGGGLDPHWFDYPSGLMYVLAPFQAWQHEPSYLAARLVVAAFGVGAVAGVVVARAGRVRAEGGARRRGGGRGVLDARRLLPRGGHRRAADRCGRGLARARGHRPPRVGRSRGRGRDGLQVSGRAARRAARGRRLPASCAGSPSRSGSSSRVRAHEPVRPPAPARGLGGRVAGEQAGPDRLARVRARRLGAGRVRPPALERARPGAADRRRRARGRALAPAPRRISCSPRSRSPTRSPSCRSTRTSAATCCRSSRRSARSPAACARSCR